jgi:hypothetical protein
MTAFLDTDRLRRQALPGSLTEILDPRRDSPRRPVLIATWQVGSDGRLTCRWDTDDPGTERPPR